MEFLSGRKDAEVNHQASHLLNPFGMTTHSGKARKRLFDPLAPWSLETGQKWLVRDSLPV
jgi:hypothetical protein